ncbi:MAG: NAD-dependent epimerase/dehydratase family protein [Chloroflexota bacterium]|jgi:nucleoside-diphosphate-sugar epimerase
MIFVTGATGLVGSYLLHSLIKQGRPVKALLLNQKSLERTRKIFSSLGSNPDELLSKVSWVEGNILDVTVLDNAMKDIEQVYHCAAIVSFDPDDKNIMMKVNVEGTANVVNAALANGVKKLCHVSSIASLGRTDESNIIDENSEWRASPYNSRYSKSKYLGEREVWRASAEGLPVIIVNPAIILGYGHPEKGSTRLFKAIHKSSMFYGKGTNGYVDVQDVVKAMIMLMDSDIKNERFVVSAGNFSYKEIFGMIAKGFNKPVPRIAVPDLVLEVIWRFEAMRTAIFKHKPLITRETATTSRKNCFYSSNKLIETLDYKYRPMKETIESICEVIVDELNGSK